MTDLTQREMKPEWLDTLPPQDPRAARSRRDLQRVNAWMGHVGMMVRMLTPRFEPRNKLLTEIGAGDGTFALRVVRRLAPERRPVKIVLVDRHRSVSAGTLDELGRFGCEVEIIVADVFDWLEDQKGTDGTLMIANLFLHHFGEAELRHLFRLAAAKTELLAACEPRRAKLALAGSRLLGPLGCNAVTRHDAVVSVASGFAGRELSVVWPDPHRWEIKEGTAGLFSHVFLASRRHD